MGVQDCKSAVSESSAVAHLLKPMFIYISVYYNDEWNIRYLRQCAPQGVVGDHEGRQCMERTGTYRVKMRYCHCDNQDGCNGAGSVHISITMILLAVLSSLGLMYSRL